MARQRKGPKSSRSKLITKGLAAAHRESDVRRKIERALIIDRTGRTRVAARFQQRLLNKVLKSAGIDPALIAARHESDNRAAQARLKSLLPLAKANSQLVARRHAGQLAMLKKQYRKAPQTPHPDPGPPDPNPPPVQVVILSKASKATLNEDDGQGTSFATGDWNNFLKTRLTGSGDSVLHVSCDFTFMHTPKRSGLMHVWTWVDSNGLCTWSLDSDCAPVMDIVWSRAAVNIIQTDKKGTLLGQLQLDQQDLGKMVDEGAYLHCTGGSGFGFFDGFIGFETTAMDMPISATQPVQIVVSLTMQVALLGSSADLDYSSGDHRINIPAVILNIA